MKNWFASFGSADKERITSVYDIHPDVAEAFIAGVRRDVSTRRPRHAADFTDLIAVIAQSARMIQAFEELRDAAIAKADATSPHADRKQISIAAAMPASRLYRVLEKYGRPRNRKTADKEN